MTYKEIKKNKGKKFSFLNEANGYLITGTIGLEYGENKEENSLVLYCDDEERTVIHFWYSEDSEIYLPEFKIVENKFWERLTVFLFLCPLICTFIVIQNSPLLPGIARLSLQILLAVFFGWYYVDKIRKVWH
jgi:hypothetical protein